MLISSVHINLVELWELDVEVGRAELVNLLNRTRSLFAKLVAGEVENLEAILGVFLIQRLQFLILWCESASGSGVHNQ